MRPLSREEASAAAATPASSDDERRSPAPRVCFLAEAFYPSGGGIGTYGLALARRLRARGSDVLVVTRRDRASLSEVEELSGVAVHRVGPTGFPRLGKYLMVVPALLRLLALRDRYDLIYVFGFRILGVAGLLAARILDRPCVLRSDVTGEARGDFLLRSDPASRSATARRVFRGLLALRNRALRTAPRFVCISREISREFRDAGFPENRIERIPNGVDIEAFTPLGAESSDPHPGEARDGDRHEDRDAGRNALRERLGLPRDVPICLYTGRLDPEKQLDLLLRVWRRIAERRAEPHLVIIGESGGYRGRAGRLREYVAEHGLGDRVTFTGHVDDVVGYLRAGDLFVLPSRREGFSISLLEAQACALPAVASATSGTDEIIEDGDTGLLVEIGSEDELEAALLELLDDPAERSAMGRRGRARVRRRYSLESAARRHQEVFESVLADT